jgi:sulfur carrier protein
MGITVNNKEYEYVENETVSGLLKRLKFRFPLIIVKINGKLVSRDNFTETIIPPGAVVSAVHLISGG